MGVNQVSLYRTPDLPESIENAGMVLRVASVSGYGESSDLLLSMELNGFSVYDRMPVGLAELCSAGGHQLMDSREDCTGIRAYPTSAYAMDVYALMESCAAGDMTPEEAAAQILIEMKMIRDE